MSHRTVIKFLIVVVIMIVVAWSVVNISDYAHTFHASWVVWTMGAALGTANALSVYAFVMAKTVEVQRPAIIGIVLFGGMSAALQVLLYLQVGAPMLAALAFGCFGPVAEGVLAWLHAALSDEVVKQGKQAPVKQPARPAKSASTVDTGNVKQQKVTPLTPELTALIALGDTELGKKVGVTRQSVYKWRTGGVLVDKLAERLPQLAVPHTNGFNHDEG